MGNFDNSDMLQYMLMQNQGGGGSGSWTALGLLAGFLLVFFYKRELVTSWILLRMAIILYALSLVLPAFVMGVTIPITRFSLGNNAVFETVVVQGLASCLGPASLAISMVCFFSSVMPRRSSLVSQTIPQKHPLDD